MVGVSDRVEGTTVVEARRHDVRVRGLQSRGILGGKTRAPRAADGLHVFLGLHQSHQVHRPEQIDDHHILERWTGKKVYTSKYLRLQVFYVLCSRGG